MKNKWMFILGLLMLAVGWWLFDYVVGPYDMKTFLIVFLLQVGFSIAEKGIG